MTASNPAPVDAPTPGRVVALAARIPARGVAVAATVGIGVFVVLGIVQRVAFRDWGLANLDSEVSLATRFSAALLWAGAFWWLLVAITDRPRSPTLWLWWPILTWLALDEGIAVHERLERWSGIDWQVLYIPIMAVAAVAWLGLMRRYRSESRIVALLVAGAAAWVVALTAELIQNWGGAPVQAVIYNPTMIAEEALEMIGSTVLLLAAILALQIAAKTRPETET